MSTNALVVGPVDTSSALSGTMLLESLAGLSEALESGSWLDIALSGLSTVLDTAAAVMDPLGQLLAAGLGWLMEHLQPLKGWLNDLTGDPGAVTGFAATWQNIAAQTSSAADGYARLVAADLEGMAGEGIEAYGRYADDLAKHLLGMSGSASAVASSLQVAATVVQVVHDIVRDALAEIVGAAISWAAEIVLTVGLGTPWVVSQVATRVSSLATRVGGKVTALIGSTRSLRNLIDALKGALSNLAQGLRGARPGPMHTPDVPRLPDAPDVTPRTYSLADGRPHDTRFAPEQIDTRVTAADRLDAALADGDLFARHGMEPWTRDELVQAVMTPVSDLTASQKAILREIADQMPVPHVGDSVQKVLTPDQVLEVLDPATSGSPSAAAVKGSITRIEDSAGLGDVRSLQDGLRLDYDDTTFLPHDESVYAVRFSLEEDVAEISRFSEMGGLGRTDGWHDPYTGNGFLKSDALVPEFRIDSPVGLPHGAEMWEVLKDGTQRLAAVFDGAAGWVQVQ